MEALQDGNSCIAIDPKCAYGYGARAIAYYGMEKHEEVLIESEKAYTLVPTYYQIYTTRSGSLYKLKRLPEALEAANKAISLSSSCSAAYASKGYILLALERPAEALEAFNQAIHYDPKYALAFCGKGTTLVKLGRDREALDAYNQSHKLTSTDNVSGNMTSATRSIASDALSKSRTELLKKLEDFTNRFGGSNRNNNGAAASADQQGGGNEFSEIISMVGDAMNPDKKNTSTQQIEGIILRMQQYEARFSKIEKDHVHLQQSKADRSEVSHAIATNATLVSKTVQMTEIQGNEKLLDYYDAFVSTFSASYTTSQAVLSGKLSLDTGDMKVTLAASGLSLIPFCGSILGDGLTAVSGFLTSAKVSICTCISLCV
jgi:tetratricopeptide (TPR) repeat protein